MFLRRLETAASISMPGARKSPITVVTSKNPVLRVIVFAFAIGRSPSAEEGERARDGRPRDEAEPALAQAQLTSAPLRARRWPDDIATRRRPAPERVVAIHNDS
jgi:hypothetical protein